jgi:DME family drug/metabolite transporter
VFSLHCETAILRGKFRQNDDRPRWKRLLQNRNHSLTTPYSAPAKPPATSPPEPQQSGDVRRGLLLGIGSAVSYSLANLALRGLSGRHDDLAWSIWVSAIKALPTVILAACLLWRRRRRGLVLYPTAKPIPILIAGAFLMQFGGNLGFQVALGHIGLAITVPFVFAFIICAGVMLGKMFLGDRVSPKTVLSMLIMTASIILLSYAAKLAATVSDEGAADTTTKIVWFGILMAVVSGSSYGINGVVIRKIARDTLPIESILIIYSLTGLICFGTMGPLMLGQARLLQILPDEWTMMFLAGIFNAIAFFCITHALKLLNITLVNVVNASQNAMCAVIAVAVYSEPVSTPLILGIGLSIVGLLALDRK